MCRLARIAAIIPSTRFRSSSGGVFLKQGRIELDVAPRVPPKTRSTILARLVARSVCRMTLRYPFLHGTRNLESRGMRCIALRNPECDGLLLPALRMFDHAAAERFLKTEDRGWCWRGTSLPNCCKHWRSGVRRTLRNGWIGDARDSGRICPLRLRREEQAVLRRGDGGCGSLGPLC